VSLTSSTVSGNVAGGAGGGVSVRNSSANPSFTIVNSIVAGNTDNGTGPDLLPDPDSTLTINHSLIGNTSSGLTVTQLQAITNGAGNLQNINPLLGPLANNGGPTQTHALLPGSPALDAGNPSTLPNFSFESAGVSLDNWITGNNAALSTAQALDGTHSAQLSNHASGFSVLHQSLSVEERSEVVASVQALVDADLSPGQFGELKIEFYSILGDDPPVFISQAIVITANANTTPGEWNLVENVATVPAGAVEARIVLTYVGMAGSIFYDTVSVLGAGETPRFDRRGAPFGRLIGPAVDIGAYEA